MPLLVLDECVVVLIGILSLPWRAILGLLFYSTTTLNGYYILLFLLLPLLFKIIVFSFRTESLTTEAAVKFACWC